MSEQPVRPEKINKPIQLLGAWLAGLFSIDSCFLVAATNMQSSAWEAKALVIAAIVNVPLFLAAVFLLQTKFRPEMQEDLYYSSYLSRKTNELVSLDKDDVRFAELRQKLDVLERRMPVPAGDTTKASADLVNLVVGVNKNLVDEKEIAAKLKKWGIVGYEPFGSDEAPSTRTVAISKYMSNALVSKVIQLARELKFDGYSMFDPRVEGDNEHVLFGAYGGSDVELFEESI